MCVHHLVLVRVSVAAELLQFTVMLLGLQGLASEIGLFVKVRGLEILGFN